MSFCTARFATEKAVFRPALPLHSQPEFTGERPMATYREQYLHPNWQRRRLEIMQAADFSCEACGATDITLNVHHKRYVKGRKVWEYERQDLACLCEDCHEVAHAHTLAIGAELALVDPGEAPKIHALLVGLRNGIVAAPGVPDQFVDAFLIGDQRLAEQARVAGEFARFVCDDLSHEEANELLSALHTAPIGEVIEFARDAAERARVKLMEQTKDKPLDDLDFI